MMGFGNGCPHLADVFLMADNSSIRSMFQGESDPSSQGVSISIV